MPNVYFYGYGSDIVPIIDAAFEIEGCRVFEAYSAPGEYLREFQSAQDVEQFLFADADRQQWLPGYHLAIWPSEANKDVCIETYALNPKVCKGKTWRQKVAGWGAIIMEGGDVRKNKLRCSAVGVNSEARALGWEGYYSDQMGPVAAWSWPLVAKTHRRLGYVIRKKLAVEKVNGQAVLPEASRLLRNKLIEGFAG